MGDRQCQRLGSGIERHGLPIALLGSERHLLFVGSWARGLGLALGSLWQAPGNQRTFGVIQKKLTFLEPDSRIAALTDESLVRVTA
jgi:hypothetical protein